MKPETATESLIVALKNLPKGSLREACNLSFSEIQHARLNGELKASVELDLNITPEHEVMKLAEILKKLGYEIEALGDSNELTLNILFT